MLYYIFYDVMNARNSYIHWLYNSVARRQRTLVTSAGNSIHTLYDARQGVRHPNMTDARLEMSHEGAAAAISSCRYQIILLDDRGTRVSN